MEQESGTRKRNKKVEQESGTRKRNKKVEQESGTRKWNKKAEQESGTRPHSRIVTVPPDFCRSCARGRSEWLGGPIRTAWGATLGTPTG